MAVGPLGEFSQFRCIGEPMRFFVAFLSSPARPYTEFYIVNRLGYAILGLAFNRGSFDIILPAALICLCAKYTSIIVTCQELSVGIPKIF